MKAKTWMTFCAWVLVCLSSTLAHAQSLVGRLQGEADVSATGAARYVVPLPLPAGTNGVAPALAVAYDTRGGNGLLGAGFRLSGLSQIHRCPRTVAQDGATAPVALDLTDRYCLDGKRLRLVSGTYGAAGSRYQTEVEEYSRVTANGTAGAGPTSFTVETRDGLIYDYGATSDSRIESVGSSTPRAWAVNRIRDRNGNVAEFVYSEDTVTGSHHPLTVTYTGNVVTGAPAVYVLRFIYEARPASDILSGYFAGGPLVESQRLDRIDVVHIASSTLVRKFDFTYAAATSSGRSRLASLQVCGASECLPATRFDWQLSLTGWGWWDIGTGIDVTKAISVMPGDTNGDGCEDLTYFDASSARWYVLLGNAVGYAGPALSVSVGSATTTPADAVSIDLDGDGKRDMLVPGYVLNFGAMWYWMHHTTGSTYVFTPTNVMNAAAPGGAIAADVDGDGLEDLVYAKTGNTSIFWRRNTTAGGVPSFAREAALWTSPSGTTAPNAPFGTNAQRFRSIVRRGDFNGDGRTDLLFQQQIPCAKNSGCSGTRIEWHALVSQGSSLVSRAVFATSSIPFVGDFNADGLTDVLYSSATGGTTPWKVQLATGANAVSASAFAPATSTSLPASLAGATILDWDADRRTDVMYPSATAGWQFCRWNGSGFDACASVGSIADAFTGSPMPTDVNGDGVADVTFPAVEWRYRLRQPGEQDLLSVVTDGLGNTARYTYSTLADRAVHTPGTGAAFPVRDTAVPMPVVSRLTLSDGAGSTYSLSMTYEGARIHVQGRGFLGFARRTSIDSRTGLAQVTDYRQDPASFETIGLPSLLTLRQAGGQPVERQAFTWARKEYGVAPDVRRFAFPATVVTDRFELDGVRVATSSAVNTYDDYGTLIDQTVTFTEIARGMNPGAQHTGRSTRTVLNDATSWCLGRPVTATERRSHTLPGGAELARTRNFTWDAAKCRVTQEVVEPLNPTLQLVTDRGYDTYGNVVSFAVTPVGQPTRRTTFAWTDNGRFLGTVTAPEGHEVVSTWDPVSGQRIQQRDANGLVTRWRYDVMGRAVQESRPDGTSRGLERLACTSTAICASGDAAYAIRETEYTASGAALRSGESGFDSLERPVYAKQEQVGGTYSIAVVRYDARGFRKQISFPAICCASPTRWFTYTYDLLGRPLTRERPTSEVDATPAVTRYRNDGLSVTETDPLGRPRTRRVDVLGNIVQTVDAAGIDTDYEYDAFGNLVKVRDVAGSETSVTYDVLGRQTRLVDPNAGTWTYTYLASGELSSLTNPKGQTSVYSYDLLGRRVTRTEPEGSTTWTWGHSPSAHNVGALASVTAPGFQETYAYDSIGRPATIVRVVAGTTLTTSLAYDGLTGLLGTITYPSVPGVSPLRLGHVRDRGRVVQLVDADNPSTVFWTLNSVNPSDRVTGHTLGNGIKATSVFDGVTGTPVLQAAGPAGNSTLQNVVLSWDAAGNLRDRTDLVRGISEQYTYDSRDRLDVVSRGGATVLDLAYDEVGNVAFKSDVGAYRYDPARKHAVVAAGSNSYSYDAAGAVASANSSAFSWFSYGLPSQVTHPNGNYSAFYYDASRSRYRHVARAGATLTDTLYAMGGLYERASRGGTIYERQYIAVDGTLVAVRNRTGTAAPTITYLLTDHLGGIDSLLSASGSLLARLSYSPFGARRAGDGSASQPTTAEWAQIGAITSRGFTGHEHLDNLGILHMNGRIYDPTLGRFLSADPLVQSTYDGQNLNRYSYVLNNPLRYTDPSGYCFVEGQSAEYQLTQCLDRIVVTAFRGPGAASSPWLDYQSLALAQATARYMNVPAGIAQQPAGQLEDIVVTGERYEPQVDPARTSDVSTSSISNSLVNGLMAAMMVAALVEPTPVGEGVVLVVTGARSRALVTYFPTNNGFLGAIQQVRLGAGQLIDRYGGSAFSRFFSPRGVPAAGRSLPPGSELLPIRTFEVLEPMTVESGMVAPAWGQLGLGLQYRTPLTLGEMLQQGILREIGP